MTESTIGRSVSPTLYTLKQIDLITEKQRKAAMRNPRLLDKLCRGIVICHAEPGHRHDEVRNDSILHSPKHLVVVVQRGEGFKRKEVIAPNGYRFVLTNAGRSLAERKEGPYESIVTRKQFLAGHEQMRERLVRVMSSIKSRKAPSLVGDEEEFADMDFEEFLRGL